MYRQSEKKLVKQQYLLHMSSQYGELRPSSGWDRFVSLGHPSKFQRLSLLGSVTARHSSSGRQPNFAALNRERHLYSAGRPSRWAFLAHILVWLVEWPSAWYIRVKQQYHRAVCDRIGGTLSWSTYSMSSWLLARVFWRPIVIVSRTLRDSSTCRALRPSTNTSFWLSLSELKPAHQRPALARYTCGALSSRHKVFLFAAS